MLYVHHIQGKGEDLLDIDVILWLSNLHTVITHYFFHIFPVVYIKQEIYLPYIK